VLGFLRNRK